MTANTRKMWPIETPEQIIERVRLAQGDAEAALVAKALGMEPPARKKQVRRRVGNKAKVRKAIPAPKRRGLTREEAKAAYQERWNRDNDSKKGRPMYNRSGLPSSGAPRPPKKVA